MSLVVCRCLKFYLPSFRIEYLDIADRRQCLNKHIALVWVHTPARKAGLCFLCLSDIFFYLALPFSVTGFQVLIKADRQEEWEGIIYKIWCTYVNLIPF